jgi:hypothetical protein
MWEEKIVKVNKEKTNKLKINKGQLPVRIMAGLLAIMMLLSVCATCVYYLYSYFSA